MVSLFGTLDIRLQIHCSDTFFCYYLLIQHMTMYNTNIHHSRRHVQSKVFPIIYTEHTNPPVHMVHSLYWLRESTCQHLIQTTKPIEKGQHLVDIKIKETKLYSFLQCSQPLIWVVLSLAWVQWISLPLRPLVRRRCWKR